MTWRGTQVAGLLALWTALIGCGGVQGRVELMSTTTDLVGFKMIRPGTQVRVCGFESPLAKKGEGTLLRAALHEMMAVDPEANLVREAQLRWRGLDLLVVRFGCATVRGDVGGMTATVDLPMVGGHEHHHPDAP